MRFNCINLKYLALYVVLSLSWIAHNTHAAISASGTPSFESATGGFYFSAYKNTNYNSPGIGIPNRNYALGQGIVQIQWGLPFDEDGKSAYILRNETTTNIQLNELFTIAYLEHVNKRIVGTSFLNQFTMYLTANLNVNGTDVGPIDFSNILVSHDETLNPRVDIAAWESLPLIHQFSVSGINYTLTVFGINPLFDTACPGRCFYTPETEITIAPIQATLTATPIPEPSTYLILSSMVGLIIIAARYKSRQKNFKLNESKIIKLSPQNKGKSD